MGAGGEGNHFQEFHTLAVTSYRHQAMTRWFDEAKRTKVSNAADELSGSECRQFEEINAASSSANKHVAAKELSFYNLKSSRDIR